MGKGKRAVVRRNFILSTVQVMYGILSISECTANLPEAKLLSQDHRYAYSVVSVPDPTNPSAECNICTG